MSHELKEAMDYLDHAVNSRVTGKYAVQVVPAHVRLVLAEQHVQC